MRKSDIRRKPQLHKYGNKIRTSPTPEEKEEAQQLLILAKSQAKPCKVLPRGFGSNFISKKQEV